jgi:hypothetical protein
MTRYYKRNDNPTGDATMTALIQKPARTLRIIKKIDANTARVRIATPDKTGEYLVIWTGDATAIVHEFGPVDTGVYHVSPTACDCKGFTYRGRCKHRDAVAVLARLRKPAQ